MEWIIRGLRLSLLCKVCCKEALTAAETLLYFMENQDDVDCVDLLQIRGHIRNKICQQKNQTEITDFLTKLL
jgi:hypothetical protein